MKVTYKSVDSYLQFCSLKFDLFLELATCSMILSVMLASGGRLQVPVSQGPQEETMLVAG